MNLQTRVAIVTGGASGITNASVRVTATGCEVLTTIPRKIYQK